MSFELFYPLGALLLVGVIGWLVWSQRHRSRRNRAISEAATRELYKHPERYEAKTKNDLERQVEPEPK